MLRSGLFKSSFVAEVADSLRKARYKFDEISTVSGTVSLGVFWGIASDCGSSGNLSRGYVVNPPLWKHCSGTSKKANFTRQDSA